jgi:hypothetical protein
MDYLDLEVESGTLPYVLRSFVSTPIRTVCINDDNSVTQDNFAFDHTCVDLLRVDPVHRTGKQIIR